jgi:hypothetical protein
MSSNSLRVRMALESLQAFQDFKREGDFTALHKADQEDAIVDVIADVGHLANDLRFDFVKLVARAVGLWSAERRHRDGDHLEMAHVEIIINGKGGA